MVEPRHSTRTRTQTSKSLFWHTIWIYNKFHFLYSSPKSCTWVYCTDRTSTEHQNTNSEREWSIPKKNIRKYFIYSIHFSVVFMPFLIFMCGFMQHNNFKWIIFWDLSNIQVVELLLLELLNTHRSCYTSSIHKFSMVTQLVFFLPRLWIAMDISFHFKCLY